MAGELREENMRTAETANIWGIQTEKKKKGRYSSPEAEEKKKILFSDPQFLLHLVLK